MSAEPKEKPRLEPRPLLVATRNPGKIRELAAMLVPAGIEVVGLAADEQDVEETGSTFEANARLKAEGYSQNSDLPVLADDSGLEVDALGGAPGVHSARYGGPHLDDDGRNRAVLAALEGTAPDRRTGRFKCVLALAHRGKTIATFEGTAEGRILDHPRGTHGFGYDPLFFHPPTNRTFAELTRAEKQHHSHRGQAVAAFLAALEQHDPRLVALFSAPNG